MAVKMMLRKGIMYDHTVLVQCPFSTRRNSSKSVMKAGASSFRAMSSTLYRVLMNSDRCL